MPKSVRDLYTRSLELLGVAASGQTPEAEDWEAMRNVLPPLLAELNTLSVLNLALAPGDETSTIIPDACFGPLAVVLANEAGPSFGIPMSDRSPLITRLCAVTYGQPQYFPQDVSYF